MINPFELLKNFQNMQERMQNMQQQLQSIEVTSAVGADLVRITMSGDMKVRKVEISPELFSSGNVGMLEALILSAFTDAIAKIQEQLREQFGDGANIFGPGLLGGQGDQTQ